MPTKNKIGVRSRARKKSVKKPTSSPKAKNKVVKVMHEYKEGKLHSGSKKGPKVKSRKQAIAIALHEAGVSKDQTAGKKKLARVTQRKKTQ
jgi:hypothetical protein